jgi:hypothetical protein
MNLHHGDTEGAENEIKTTFVSELKIVSVNSVPLWWILRISAVGEDLRFTGHDQTLRIDHLLFRIRYPVASLSYRRKNSPSTEIRTMAGFYLRPTNDDNPLPDKELNGFTRPGLRPEPRSPLAKHAKTARNAGQRTAKTSTLGDLCALNVAAGWTKLNQAQMNADGR